MYTPVRPAGVFLKGLQSILDAQGSGPPRKSFTAVPPRGDEAAKRAQGGIWRRGLYCFSRGVLTSSGKLLCPNREQCEIESILPSLDIYHANIDSMLTAENLPI